MKTTIDSAGRIVIPRDIRKAAGLEGSAEVDVDVDDDGVISIQRARGNVRILKQGKLYVAVPQKQLRKIGQKEVNAVVKRLRERRDIKFR